MNEQNLSGPRLTSLSHGGGCGCKIAPGVLREILRSTTAMPLPPELLVGIETADDAAVYKLNETQALVATTDFFMPIVDDALPQPTPFLMFTPWGRNPSWRWPWWACQSMFFP